MLLVETNNPVLSQKCQKVTDFGDEFQKNLTTLISEHIRLHGVGLAAPQIGIPQRFSVIGFQPTPEELKKNPDIVQIDQFVIVNPEITWHSNDTAIEKEGCLSIPEKVASASRYKKIHLEYQDEKGNKKKLKARGYLARIIQHEVDHLEGLTIGRFIK